MHAFTRTKRAGWAALAGLLLVLSTSSTASAKPAPGYKGGGFRLFSRVTSAIAGNRVNCGIISDGRVCPDSTGSSVVGGGFWPRGTLNQYVFNSGMQIAGIIDSQAPMSWRGSTEGAFFFNAQGTANGTPLTNVYRSSDPGDVATWPDAAKVPQGDVTENLFAPALRGKISASAQDVWFLSWDGDPNKLQGRQHTLGVMTETRGMAFNTAGKEDILFFIYTIYNVTCDGTVAEGASCYDAARPSIRDTLKQVGHRFVESNSAKFGEDLPLAGYRIQGAYVAFGADNDVTVEDSGNNYDGVSVPFSVGYTYHKSFTAEPSWTFDPAIYRAPFFAGAGFIGVKYLKSPVGPDGVTEVGLTLFGATTNGGEFSDPVDTKALYRYLSGTNSSALGDDVCNVGDVNITHICYINQRTAADMRFFEASGPLTLGPGEFTSIVVAYIFAAPVQTAACTHAGCQSSIPPQDPTNSLTRVLSPDSVVLGVNTVDKMTGFVSYNGDANANGKIDQDEITTVPGSLLGKAATAQAVFGSGFAQPEAPAAPTYYLVPGDNQVTVLWLPSTSETTGDNYFTTAQAALTYDPNYRFKDVVGYRVYRGNNQDPSTFRLLGQFNYGSDNPVMTFTDHTGQVDQPGVTKCAPEVGVFTTDTLLPPCVSTGLVNGVPTIQPVDVDMAAQGQLVQRTGASTLSGDTTALATTADTALTGKANNTICGTATPCTGLNTAGVPFIYVDKTVSNNRTYFYTVTAFDLNSIRSGPSSQESARIVKPIVPSPSAAGTPPGSGLAFSVFTPGRGPALTGPAPTLDPTTGEWSGPQLPANGGVATFVGDFVSQLYEGVNNVDFTLTDLVLGDSRFGSPVTYTFKVTGPKDTVILPLTFVQTFGKTGTSVATNPMALVPVDPHQAAVLGFNADRKASVAFTLNQDAYQKMYAEGRGCVDGTVTIPGGSTCGEFGPRWFDGANEHTPHPNAGTGLNNGLNNAGALTGVARIQWASTLANFDGSWRNVDASLAGAWRAADYKFYWGNAGKVDSVIDITHNAVVPFQPNNIGGGWGIMTQAASNAAGSADGRPGEVSAADLGCVEPMYNDADGTDIYGMGAFLFCASAAPFSLVDSAVAGPVVISTGADGNMTDAAAAPNPGFVIYVAGGIYTIELAPGASVPSSTVWTLRTYSGSIFTTKTGKFSFQPAIRPFSALGSAVRMTYTAHNTVVHTPDGGANLANVHTVPDPYYVTSGLETTTDAKTIKFVNLPTQANIRIYTTSGLLVRVLQHSNLIGNFENWDVRNRNNQFVASGVYFYSIEDPHTGARKVGRMTIINFTR